MALNHGVGLSALRSSSTHPRRPRPRFSLYRITSRDPIQTRGTYERSDQTRECLRCLGVHPRGMSHRKSKPTRRRTKHFRVDALSPGGSSRLQAVQEPRVRIDDASRAPGSGLWRGVVSASQVRYVGTWTRGWKNGIIPQSPCKRIAPRRLGQRLRPMGPCIRTRKGKGACHSMPLGRGRGRSGRGT